MVNYNTVQNLHILFLVLVKLITNLFCNELSILYCVPIKDDSKLKGFRVHYCMPLLLFVGGKAQNDVLSRLVQYTQTTSQNSLHLYLYLLSASSTKADIFIS